MGLFDFSGVPLRPSDMQNAVTMQSFANEQALRHYTRSPADEVAYIRDLRPYRMFPERPLDERFADFKIRLAAAIAKRANLLL